MMAILWKEWRQQRGLILLFVVAGLAFVVFDGLQQVKYRHGFQTDTGEGVVLGFGAVVGLIVAAATTMADMRRGVRDFWQSRPIRPAVLLTTKLALGAVLLLAAFLAIQSLDFATHSGWIVRFGWSALSYTWPIAMMLFASTMLLVVLTRDAARAVLAAIWLGLLVYFLPLLIGRLEWLNIFEQLGRHTNEPSVILDVARPAMGFGTRFRVAGSGEPYGIWQVIQSPGYADYLRFLALTIGTTAGALVLSIVALRRDWHWRPGQKTLAWVLGGTGAVMFAAAMFQVGHDMKPAATWQGRPIDPVVNFHAPAIHQIDWVTPDEPQMGKPAPSTFDPDLIGIPPWDSRSSICISGDLMYRVSSRMTQQPDWRDQERPVRHNWFLDIYRHPGADSESNHLVRVRFLTTEPLSQTTRPTPLSIFLREDRLYVLYPAYQRATGNRDTDSHGYERLKSIQMLVVDVSDLQQPRRVLDQEIAGANEWLGGGSVYGPYCYLAGRNELLILSVANRDQPEIVKRIPGSDFGTWRGIVPMAQMSIDGHRLLCAGSPYVLVLDLADPLSPKVIARQKLIEDEDPNRAGILAVTVAGDYLYTSTRSGIAIYRIVTQSPAPDAAEPPARLEYVGGRRATPLEMLSSRWPQNLFVLGNRLYEAAGPFGLLVYDVSDPGRPRRVSHGAEGLTVQQVGTWQGQLYASGGEYTYWKLLLLDVPEAWLAHGPSEAIRDITKAPVKGGRE